METELCMKDVLLESAKEVFETMVFMELAEAIDTNPTVDENDLMGLITFKGDINGCLGIRCSKSCGENIAKNMLGMDPDEQISSEQTYDAIGEITNMVMGSVKVRIEPQTGSIQVSIPSVVQGQKLTNSLGEREDKSVAVVDIEGQDWAELSFLCRHETGDI